MSKVEDVVVLIPVPTWKLWVWLWYTSQNTLMIESILRGCLPSFLHIVATSKCNCGNNCHHQPPSSLQSFSGRIWTSSTILSCQHVQVLVTYATPACSLSNVHITLMCHRIAPRQPRLGRQTCNAFASSQVTIVMKMMNQVVLIKGTQTMKDMNTI